MADEVNPEVNPDLLIRTAMAEAMPQYFKSGLQTDYPTFITARGYGSGYNNAIMEMRQREAGKARGFATASDSDRAAQTIVSMFTTAAAAAGKTLSDEQMAKVYQAARMHGGNLEAYFGMAKAMGVTDTAINNMRQFFYGDKGSTANMFDTLYGATSQRYGDARGLNIAKHLAKYQFGAGYDAKLTGGLNADEYATVHAFMLENGGLVGNQYANGGGMALTTGTEAFKQAVNAAPDLAVGGAELFKRVQNVMYDESTGLGQRNLAGVRAMNAAYQESIKGMNNQELKRELGGFLNKNAKAAFDRVHALDKELGKLGEKHKIKIDTTNRDVNKGIESIEEQFTAYIEEAEAEGDEETVEMLTKAQERATSLYKEAMKYTGERDDAGNELNSFELTDKTDASVAKVASAKMDVANKAVDRLMYDEASLKKKLIKAYEDKDSAKIKEAEQQLAQTRLKLQEIRSGSEAGKIAVEAKTGGIEALERNAAVGNAAKAIMDAMAMNGKPIQVDEALQASKALMPLSADTNTLRQMSEVIGRSMAGLGARHGSVEQYLANMSISKDIAKQYGLNDMQAMLSADMAQSANKVGGEMNLTLQQQQAVQERITRQAAKNNTKVTRATILRHVAGNNMEGLQEGLAKMSGDARKRAEELIAAVQSDDFDISTLSESDMAIIGSVLQNAGYDSKALLNTSSLAKAATGSNKDFYQRQAAKLVQKDDLRQFKFSGDLNRTFGSPEKSMEAGKALLSNFSKISEAVGVGSKDALQEAIIGMEGVSEDIKQGFMDILKGPGGVAKFTSIFEQLQDTASERGALSAAEVEAKYKATATYDKYTAENNKDYISGMAMGADNKAVFQNVMAVTGTDEFKNASNQEKQKMIAEAVGKQMSEGETAVLMQQMLRHGSLGSFAGMRYTDKHGNEATLTQEDLAFAQEYLQDPNAIRQKIAEAKANGMTSITVGPNGDRIKISDIESGATQYAIASVIGNNFKLKEEDYAQLGLDLFNGDLKPGTAMALDARRAGIEEGLIQVDQFTAMPDLAKYHPVKTMAEATDMSDARALLEQRVKEQGRALNADDIEEVMSGYAVTKLGMGMDEAKAYGKEASEMWAKREADVAAAHGPHAGDTVHDFNKRRREYAEEVDKNRTVWERAYDDVKGLAGYETKGTMEANLLRTTAERTETVRNGFNVANEALSHLNENMDALISILNDGNPPPE